MLCNLMLFAMVGMLRSALSWVELFAGDVIEGVFFFGFGGMMTCIYTIRQAIFPATMLCIRCCFSSTLRHLRSIIC